MVLNGPEIADTCPIEAQNAEDQDPARDQQDRRENGRKCRLRARWHQDSGDSPTKGQRHDVESEEKITEEVGAARHRHGLGFRRRASLSASPARERTAGLEVSAIILP